MNPDKPVHANNVPTAATGETNRGQVTEDQIRGRAEKLWRDRQQPSGQDDAIWLEAEAQLKAEAEARPVAGTPSRPYIDEPATQVKSRTKVQDSAESAVQTRSATDAKAKKSAGKLRNR